MKNRVIGLWIVFLSILQFAIVEGLTIYQYTISSYATSSMGMVFDFISLIPLPAIFLFIGLYIRNQN